MADSAERAMADGMGASACLETPWGPLWLSATAAGLCRVSNRPPDHGGDASDVTVADGPADTPAGAPADTPAGGHLAEALVQLGAYVEGLRQAFDLALDLRTASPFDRRVWRAASRCPLAPRPPMASWPAAIGAPGAAGPWARFGA
jgi:O6-methylguanine-DNA--protein-cysteine methyltransferase